MGEWISWRQDYSIGVNKIDEQHQELFRIFNTLGDALWDGKGKDVIGETLTFLTKYTVEHFETEEKYMKETSYPAFDEHKKAHNDFVQEVKQFVHQFDTQDLAMSNTIGIFSRLGDWTREHVRGLDQELGHYLTSYA